MLTGSVCGVTHRTVIENQELLYRRLVPLFPTFSLIAHFIVGTERGVEALRATALFGLYSLIPYAGYLLAVYLFSARYGVWMTLSLATAVWVVLAAGLLVSWSRLSPALG